MFVTEIAVSPDNNIRVENRQRRKRGHRCLRRHYPRHRRRLRPRRPGITSLKWGRQAQPLRCAFPPVCEIYSRQDLEVLADGRKLHGVLAPTDGRGDAFGFTIEVPLKIKGPAEETPA